MEGHNRLLSLKVNSKVFEFTNSRKNEPVWCSVKSKALTLLNQPAYIKYVGAGGGGGGGVYKFFVVQETKDLNINISWPSDFLEDISWPLPSSLVSYLRLTYLQQYFRVVLTVIFKFRITGELNIHNNIQNIILK